jgi:D-glycero-D-manno-heptose 1,7-bisphosphate phosphatase
MKKNKALFLDRDGVVNKDVYYAHKPEQIEFCNGIFDLCRRALDKGYLIIVTTNQAGIAKGHFKEKDVQDLNQWMKEQFGKRGIIVSAIYYCPFHKAGVIEDYKRDDNCRKPRPGMFLEAAEEFDIDFSRSLMVGDKPSDRIDIPDLKSVILKSEYTGDDYDITSLDEVDQFL